MNHLMRELAPITDEAWAQVEAEATRSIKHGLAGRRMVDFSGPHGWAQGAVDVGRAESLDPGPLRGVEVARRSVLPLIEVRNTFTLSLSELATADRGATDLDLSAVISAARSAAMAEDHVVFHGYQPNGITGIVDASPHNAVPIGDDYSRYPEYVARAVGTLRGADIAGPFAIALGARCFTGVTETTEHGGYPVFEHLRQILGGPVVWAPAVDGAVVLSQRGGDFELTVGEDFSIGYRSHDGDSIDLYIEESLAFRINTPDAAVHLAYL
jgi:uncharacterized linocin/CFP29 family protein